MDINEIEMVLVEARMTTGYHAYLGELMMLCRGQKSVSTGKLYEMLCEAASNINRDGRRISDFLKKLSNDND